jgi:hypothetical protein
MNRKLSIAFLSLGLILFAGHGDTAKAATPPMSLAGSWQLEFVPLTPVVPPPGLIYGLATFTADGSLVETDSTEVVPNITFPSTPSYGTPGHGVWQPGPGPTQSNFYIRFLTLILNNNGALMGTKTVIVTGALDSSGNHFGGRYSYQVVDSAGNVIGNGSGRAIGDRILNPALP